MRRFVTLFREMDTTNKTAEKTAAMARYFREAPARDAAWALFFLSGRRLKRGVKTAVVREAALQASGVPPWMFRECYDAVGDLSETIALLLPPGGRGHPEEALHVVVEGRIVPLVNAGDAKSVALLMEAWGGMDPDERFVFNKLVRGNFRVGVQRALVVRALAEATGVDAPVLAHRLTGPFEPTERGYESVVSASEEGGAAPGPYPFCLAHQLDVGVDSLGDVKEWQVEWKWDGVRAQIVCRGEPGAPVAIWSRGEEPIADQFPEIARAASRLGRGTVVDGEILAWRFDPEDRVKGGWPLSFNALQSRLNRKGVQDSLFDQEGVVFAAFDLLEKDGVDLRERALWERRGLLEETVGPLQRLTDGVIRIPSLPVAGSWAQVEQERAGARERQNAEGLMLKPRMSRYHTGRVAGGTRESIGGDQAGGAGWWKWKVDPYAVDAVLMYAQQGSGRRAGLFTDYTFGVWDPEAPGTLAPFAKAYSGLDNREIQEVDAFVRANTVDRKGPVRAVKPELVFEIAFEGILESTRHRSGIAVRFPRIARWRRDKPAAEADTLATVRSILNASRMRDALREGRAEKDAGKSGGRG